MPRTPGCWANVLDDCRGKLTREHLISVTATPHDDPSASRKEKEQVLIRHHSHGGRRSWDREIRMASLASKMLCKGHNERLSELDMAGGNFCAAARAIFDLARDRRFMCLRWVLESFEVNGPLTERWLLKTAVDIAVASHDDRRIGSAAAGPNQPTVDLAEMIYGLRPIAEPYGLWLITLPDFKTILHESITVHDWGTGRNEITVGTLFSLYGFRFALSMTNQDPPWALLGNMTGWRSYQSVRHPRELRFDSIGASLVFQWPTSLATVAVARGRTEAGRPPSAGTETDRLSSS